MEGQIGKHHASECSDASAQIREMWAPIAENQSHPDHKWGSIIGVQRIQCGEYKPAQESKAKSPRPLMQRRQGTGSGRRQSGKRAGSKGSGGGAQDLDELEGKVGSARDQSPKSSQKRPDRYLGLVGS